jgi:hypothetical protein
MVWAIWRLISTMRPSGRDDSPGCSSCASGAAASRANHTQLTIRGQNV